jgi:hypothetical protein
MSKTLRSTQRSDAIPFGRGRPAQAAKDITHVEDERPHPARGSRDKSVRIGRTRVGKGVFARKRYPATTVIGEILGDVIEEAGYGSRYCMDIGNGRVLEPHAPYRYVNHSCAPNCEFDFFDLAPMGESQSLRRVFLISLREIKPGEELTIDYNWSAETAIPCRCEAPTCRGWIVNPDQLEDVPARNQQHPSRSAVDERVEPSR